MSISPGPWSARKDTNIKGDPTWRIDSDDRHDIATLIFMNKEDRDGFGADNARAIALVPEMIAALQQATSPDGPTNYKRMSEILKAIENGPYPIEDWQYEVANGDTVLGYEEWKSHKQGAE